MDIDIEAILMGDDEDALKELKLFLFKETVRLQNEKNSTRKNSAPTSFLAKKMKKPGLPSLRLPTKKCGTCAYA